MLKNIDNAETWKTINEQLYKIYTTYYTGKAFEVWEEGNDLGLLNVLKWRHNKLFSKMMLCHRGKKLRLLHSLSLFAPKTIFPDNWPVNEVIENTREYENDYHRLTEEIGKNLNNNIVNLGGVMYKYLPKNVINDNNYDFAPSAFSENKIPTIWGHKGSQSSVSDSKQVCFDYALAQAPMFYIDEFGIVYRWNTSLQKLAVLRDQKNNIFRLSMPTAKTTIEEQNNSHGNGEITQNPKEQLAENIITAIIEGRDEVLTQQLEDRFNRLQIDNEFLISELNRYNKKHDDVIKRYSWGQKFWSLGKNTARKRRINHLGKMLKGCFTRNMNKQEKKQYKKQYQQAVEEHNNKMKKFKSALSDGDYKQLEMFLATLPKYGQAKMKEINFDNLLSIAKIHSRWRCCCCGGVDVKQ